MTKENIKDIYVGQTLLAGDLNEVVTVHFIDEDNGKVYCSDEEFGISMWYDMDVLKKIDDEPEKIVLDDEFLAFARALEAVAKFNGINVPQVEIEEEPNVVDGLDDDYNDFVDDYDECDYEDDLLDERYDGNRSPDYEFNFYSALEELKFMEEAKQENEIWVMTNGERTFTFRDERLVSVRLADSVENFVYYSATIQLDDLDDTKWNWKLVRYVDEETRKLEKLVEIIQTLKDERLALELLDIIQL